MRLAGYGSRTGRRHPIRPRRRAASTTSALFGSLTRPVRLILKVLGTILVLLMVAGFLKGLAGNDNSDPQRVIRIGEKTLELPDDTPHGVFAVTRAAMEQLGYKTWYRNCIVGQAERLLTPREARELGREPKSQLSIILKAQPHCEVPGKDVLNPEATSTQLAFLKEQTAISFGLLLAKEGVGSHRRTCISNKIRYASDVDILELANGSRPAQEALVLRFINRCQ